MANGWRTAGVAAAMISALEAGPGTAATLVSEKTWGGTETEIVEGTAVAADGSVYVAGTTFGFGGDREDIFLVKYAADGTLAWDRTWGTTGQFPTDTAGDVAVAPDGSVYVAGTTVTNSNDVVLLKFDPNGVLLWQRTWGATASSQDLGDAIAVAADGSIYVTGSSDRSTDVTAFVLKFAPDGSLLWQQAWGRGVSDFGRALAIGADGTVHLAATSFRPESGLIFDTALVLFAPDGTLIAERGYAAGEIADALGIAVAADRSVYIVGSLDGADSAFVIRFSPDLSLDWQRTIGGRSGDRANAVTVAPDGSIVIAGLTNTEDASDEAFVVRMSADRARVLDDSTWGGVNIEQGIDLAFLPSGRLIVGAIAQDPPYTFRASRLKASRLRGDLVVLGGSATTLSGVTGVPSGVVADPMASETFAGASDAGVLEITFE